MDSKNIILIAGWGHDPKSLNVLADSLRLSAEKCNIAVNILQLSPGSLYQCHLQLGKDASCDYLEMLRGVITDREIKNPIIVGWSLGGMIALEYAEKFSDDVSALVLLGSTAKFVHADSYPMGVPGELLATMSKALECNPNQVLEKFFENVYFPNIKSQKIINQDVQVTLAEGVSTLQDGLFYLINKDLRRLLAGINQPTLIIHCKQDRIVSIESARYLSKHLSNAQLEELESSGHKDLVSDQAVIGKIRNFIFGM